MDDDDELELLHILETDTKMFNKDVYACFHQLTLVSSVVSPKHFCLNSDLKLHKFGAALTDCNQVLEAEPLNVKALFRRGIAHQNKNNYEQVCIILSIPNSLKFRVKTDLKR
jgi:hypothetical protein